MAVWRSAWIAALLVSASPIAVAQAPESEASVQSERVTLQADNVYVIDNENTIVAEGNVSAEYQGRVLTADKLTYDRQTARVRAQGNITILEEDGTQRFADEIETDANLADGFATGFSMRTPEGATALANSASRENETINTLNRAVFTACELCEGDTTPTWAIRAREAVLDEDDGMYTYKDAVLEIAGIPVIYLPYFAHPDPKAERRSGLLIPSIGSSSKTGVFYQQPYLWAISPSQDLTISPVVYSKVNPLLELDYRKRFWSGRVNFNVSVTRERLFDSDGEKFDDKEWRGHIFGEGKFQIDENWLWGFGVEKTTDDLYTERYDIEGENEQRGLYTNQPRILLSQLYTQGQSRNWYADASVLTFDSLRLDDSREGTIADVLPLAHGAYDFDLGEFGFAGINASTAYLSRTVGTDSHRSTVGADWSVRKILPGGFVFEPFAQARFDHYEIEDFPNEGDSGSVDRSVGAVGSRLSMPFYRPGQSVDLLIEPIVMGAFGTSGPNEEEIPIEDGLFYELDESALFDANAQAGYDLYEGDSKIGAGISAVARWKSGVKISGLAGRRWRSRDDESFDVPSNLDGTVSDWIGGFAVDLGNPFSFKAKLRLDDEDLELNRIDTSVDMNFDRFKASALYYQIDPEVTQAGVRQEGVVLTSELEITDNYFALYGLQRDIESNRDIKHSIGIGYQDDCSRFALIFERSELVDRQIGPSDSILFTFALKSLGDVGSSDFD